MVRWSSPSDRAVAGPRPALFLDRDGVLIADCHYLSDPDRVEILPGVARALVRARQAGFLLIGVSNQSGLGRGRFSADDLDAVMRRLDELLAAAGAPLDGFYYCPHAPEQECGCRKPALGLLHEAAGDFSWDPEQSWVVGDKPSDIELARNAALKAVLVLTGYGIGSRREVETRWPDQVGILVADDLAAAVDGILTASGLEPGT